MTGHVVPLDSISVEVVEDGQAGLLRWRILSSSSVVRLGKTSSSSMRPVRTLVKSNCSGVWIPPSNSPGAVVNNSSSPEESLSILSNQPVELVHLGWSVQGHGLHPHALTVGHSLGLLKVSASKLPGDNVSLSIPEVVWRLSSALGSATGDTVLGWLGEAGLGCLGLSHYCGLLGLGTEHWGLLELSLAWLGWTRLELLLLRLELLLLGLEELLLLLLLLRLSE